MVDAINIKPYLDPNYPAFKRGPALVEAYMNHANTMLSGKKDKQIYIRGQDDVLIPPSLFEELRNQVNGLSIKSNQLMGLPNKTTIDDVIARVVQEVQGQVPEMYQNQVIENLEGLRPKYATTLKEAANALGIKLPTQPQ